MNADPAKPYMFVDPPTAEISTPGESVTIKVNVTTVSNLYGFEFWLAYNSTLLTKTGLTCDGPGQVAPSDPGFRYIDDLSTPGAVRYSLAFWPKPGPIYPPSFNGSGTLAWITFNGTTNDTLLPATSDLHFTRAKLFDKEGTSIPTDPPVDGEIMLLPEIKPLPQVYVAPSSATILVGESVTIAINVIDVTDLYGYDLWVSYNNTIVDTIEVTVIGPSQVVPTNLSQYDFFDLSVPGTVKTSVRFLEGAPSFNGNGTLLWITFNGTAEGTSPLDIVDAETILLDSKASEIPMELPVDGEITVMPKIGDCHTDHINDPTDNFSNDYAPMVIPINNKNVTIAPVITCTCHVEGVFEPHYYPCKLAQTFFVDDDWEDNDAKYTYLFEDWTDYDWNDINISLYAVTNDIIEAVIHIEDREACWKNPFGVEITPMGMDVEVHWNSTDYPEEHVFKLNPNETVDIKLFDESNPCDTAFITINPLIAPKAFFVYSPLYPHVCENVTFNASASTPNGGHIISYEWDFGDASPHEFGMIVMHHYTIAGTYNVTLNVTDSAGKWAIKTETITITPKTYTLTITSTSGGTTNPIPGNHSYVKGTIVPVTAIPEANYVFDHWELNGVNVGSDTSTSVTMNKNHTLHAVFEEAPPVPVGGHAIPIDNPHFITSKIDLISGVGLAFVLLAALAVIIILIRRRNKTLRWGR